MYFFKFHIGDYRQATMHLTNEEDLAYRRLLEMYYDSERPIPTDIPWVSRRLRLDIHSVESVLNDFFTLTENGWINHRADQEIADYYAWIDKQKSNGSKGGRPKKTHGLPNANPVPTQKKPNQKPETIIQKEEIPPKSPKGESEGDPSPEYPEAFETTWAAYPKRDGGNPKRAAFKSWKARISAGDATADEMHAGVLRYARYLNRVGKTGTSYVKQAATFFGPDLHFKETFEPQDGFSGKGAGDDWYDELMADAAARQRAEWGTAA
jgi:uncharacterized protein YdaU (DUF1376 family)